MPHRTLKFPLAALLAAALLAAGCGGADSDSTSSNSDVQPPDQLVKQADEICSAANDARPKAPELGVDPSAKELQSSADYLETDLEVTSDTLDQLSELAPPEGLEEQWTTVLDGFGAVVDDYPDLIAAAKAGDAGEFLSVVKKIQRDTVDLQPAAAEVGLQVCARPG